MKHNENQGADQVSENPRAVQGEWKTVDRGFQQNVVDITTVEGRLIAAGVDNLAAENIVVFHNASLKDSKPSDCEIAQFLKEFDEGNHPLSAEDEAALDRTRPALFRKLKQIAQASEVVEEPQTLGGKDA